MTLYGGLVAINIFLDPIYHIADINYQCFVGGNEAYAIALKYTTLMSDPMKILANLGWNFGILFNSVKEIVTYFAYPERCTGPTPLDLGVNIGQIFFNILANH